MVICFGFHSFLVGLYGFMLGDHNYFVEVIVVELLACFMEKMEWMWRSGFEIDSWNLLECLSY